MNSGENRMRKSRTKSEQSRNRRGVLLCGLGALGLVMLVTAAFFGPQIVFAMQDDIRCGRIVSLSPLEVDITSFNTNYELDLYKRLERFAQGLADSRQYYVTVQDMEPTADIADWMASEQGFFHDRFQALVWNLGLIPEELFGYSLIGWKRCVIYGDDFAGGVNFILWYIELGNNGETVARLLVDGETGELYGIRTNFDPYFPDGEGESQGTLTEFYSADEGDIVLSELCLMLGDIYGGLKLLEMRSWLSSMGIEYGIAEGSFYSNISAEYNLEYWQLIREDAEIRAGKEPDYEWVNKYSAEEIQNCLERLQWGVSEEGNCLKFSFPYGDDSLSIQIRLDGKNRWLKKWKNRFMDITFGFPEIYERIPAFMADWN